MNKVSENLQIVRDDILRYKKNKLGQWLSYGGLAFACLYVMLLYSFHNSTFYTMLMGGSVMLTLVILLSAFLASEGIKVYNKKYCIVLAVLAAIEVARIFIYPNIAWNAESNPNLSDSHAFWFTASKTVVFRDYFGILLSAVAARTLLIIYLIASASLFAAAAGYSYIVCLRHESFNKKIANGEVNVELALKGLEEEELAAKAEQESAAVAAKEVQ